MKRLFIIVCLGLLSFSALAQGTRKVKGSVRDAEGEPLQGVTIKAVSDSATTTSKADGSFEFLVSLQSKFVEASLDGYLSAQAEIDGSIIVFKLKVDKKYASNKAKAEKAARIAAEQEAARLAAEREALRFAEQEAARIAAEKARAEEAARLAAERAKAEEEARIAAEAQAKAKAEEEARIAAEKEKERLIAEAKAKAKAEEEARIAAEKAKAEEDARIAAEKERERIIAEAKAKAIEEARIAAEKAKAEEEARIAAEKEKERLLAEAKAKAIEEARIAAEKEKERIIAEAKAKAIEEARIAAEKEKERIIAEAKAKAEEEARLIAEKQATAQKEVVAEQPVAPATTKVEQQSDVVEQPLQQSVVIATPQQQVTAQSESSIDSKTPSGKESEPKKPFKKNRFGQMLEFGFMATTQNLQNIEALDMAVSLNYAIGCNFNNIVFLGVGTGIIWNIDGGLQEIGMPDVNGGNYNNNYYPAKEIGALPLDTFSIPAYLHFKVNMSRDTKVAPYFALTGGAEFSPIREEYSPTPNHLLTYYQTTIFGKASLGVNFRIGQKSELYFGVGYRIDKRWGAYLIEDDAKVYTRRQYVHGLTANLGFLF